MSAAQWRQHCQGGGEKIPMQTIGTFMEPTLVLQSASDPLLDALQAELGLNLVILSYPKNLWFTQVLELDRSPAEADASPAQVQAAIDRLHARGIQAWAYLGTFSERSQIVKPEFTTRDISGEFVRPDNPFGDRRWVPSASYCPNNAVIRARYGALFQQMTRDYAIDGFFLGHNRFAPPGHEFNNLFSCACPDCVQAAAELGYDFPAMQAAMVALRRSLQHIDPRRVVELRQGAPTFLDMFQMLGQGGPAVADWFNFRCAGLARTMGEFRDAVKQVRPEVIVGQDSQPPTFSLFAGHNYRQLEACQDYLCPNVSHATIFILYVFGEIARHLCDANPGLAEADMLGLLYQLFGYEQFHLPSSVAQLIGNLPQLDYPRDTSQTEIPLDRIVPHELKKAGLLSTGKLPLYTLIAFGKLELTPEGLRRRFAGVMEAGLDGAILNSNWDLGLEKLRPNIEAIKDIIQ